MSDFEEARRNSRSLRDARRRCEYAELRELDYDLFRRCVETATVIALNHIADDTPEGKRTALGADIEAALVSQALTLIKQLKQ